MFNGAALTGRFHVMSCNPGRCPGLVGVAPSARFVGSKNDEGKERRGWNYLFYCFITSYSTFLVLDTAAGEGHSGVAGHTIVRITKKESVV